MKNLIHFLNGKFVTEDQLLISPRDLGFYRGYAVHDFIVTYNQQPFELAQHIDRLFKSAKAIGLDIPWSKDQIAQWVKTTFSKNEKDTELMMTIFITGGNSFSMKKTNLPTIIMLVNQRLFKPEAEYEKGIKAKTLKYQRPYPLAKTNAYIEGVKQLSLPENNNISEIIYYDESQVFEGAGSNLFAVINDVLITPKSNVLGGVTRNILLKILRLDIPIQVKDFTVDELFKATEIFLTGSNSEIRGVVEIDGKAIGNGKVGEITKEAMKQYKGYIQNVNP